MTCLIANDEELQLSILERMIQNQNIQVQTSRNGQEAFEYVQKNFKDRNLSFDLIILDLHMPIADGYEAIKNINYIYSNTNLFKIEEENVLSTAQRR